ncbi:MAG: hypothetical protein JXR39_11575 [Marinilabiliaceae bacterium]|nr:hypothetical protein [Marinilabiliaceae bacterium]
MSNTVLGYNILLKATIESVEKKFAGTTSNSFSISAETKDSITKDDVGAKRKVVTGYSWEAGVEGLVTIKDTGETAILDRNDLIEMVKSGTEIDVVYGPAGSGAKVQKGKAVITAWSESTDSESEGTYSVTLGGTSALTGQTIV